MDAREELIASLDAVRADMSQAVTALEEALADERQALEAGDPDGLDAAGAVKTRHLETLERLDGERRHLLATIGGDESQLSDTMAWNELRERLTACHEANEVNGAIVARCLDQVRGALAALSGRAQAPATYGPKGQRLAPTLTSSRLHV